MQQKLFLMLILFLIISIAGCSNKNKPEQNNYPDVSPSSASQKQEENTDNADKPEDVVVINTHLTKLKSLNTAEELLENSEAVITGKTISSDIVFQNNTMYTISQVKVEQSIKGAIKASDLINIVEIGGRTTYGEYTKGCDIESKSFITEEIEAENEVVLDFDGFRALEKDQEVLLFLVDSSGFITDFDSKLYAVIGDFDGKLYKQDGSLYSRIIQQESSSNSSNEELTININDLTDLLKQAQQHFPKREGRLIVKGSATAGDHSSAGAALSLSDKEKSLRDGNIVKLSSKEELYLTDCGFRQKISYESDSGDGYKLTVNSCTVSCETAVTGNLYAAQLSGTNAGEDGGYNLQLLVEVKQTAEVYEYHVFSYIENDGYEYLQKLGVLPGRLLSVGEETFTFERYTDILEPFTCYYPQKYIICSAGSLVDEKFCYGIGRVPEGYYPMGSIVKLKKDILLYDRDSLEAAAKAEEGSYLMLCATDAERWIYVEDTETALSGWILLQEDSGRKRIVSDTGLLSIKDVFEGGALRYGY